MEVLYLDGGGGSWEAKGSISESFCKGGCISPGTKDEKEKETKEILPECGRLCVPNYKFNTSPSNFATVDVFFSFFPGRKIALLFSSLESPFVILKVPRCLCLWCQLAAMLLKIAGGGNRSTH